MSKKSIKIYENYIDSRIEFFVNLFNNIIINKEQFGHEINKHKYNIAFVNMSPYFLKNDEKVKKISLRKKSLKYYISVSIILYVIHNKTLFQQFFENFSNINYKLLLLIDESGSLRLIFIKDVEQNTHSPYIYSFHDRNIILLAFINDIFVIKLIFNIVEKNFNINTSTIDHETSLEILNIIRDENFSRKKNS